MKHTDSSIYRSQSKSLHVRDRVTLTYALILLVLLCIAFGLQSKADENWRDFIRGRSDIHVLSLKDLHITGSLPEAVSCNDDCHKKLSPDLNQPTQPWDDLHFLNQGSDRDLSQADGTPKRRWSQIRLELDTKDLEHVFGHETDVAVALPQIIYKSMLVRRGGETYAHFYNGQRAVIQIPWTERGPQKEVFDFDIIIELYDHSIAVRTDDTIMPPYVATSQGSAAVEKFISTQRDARGAVLGTMSRVLIAFFALFLFAVIDSTPETFGLALFLGFEAVAIVIGNNWIRVPVSKFLIHFSYQMGDIFRLYFFIQLSRVIRPRTATWLTVGTLLSIPYGISRQMEVAWGFHGLDVISRMRDLGAGSIGTVLCLYALFSIRDMTLPWRKAALIFGAACSFQQILDPLTHYFPEWNGSATFRAFMTSYQSFSVYLGALSALTNISTLENRVQKLSEAKVRSDMIEQELSLGQEVQRAFLSVDGLPDQFEMEPVHEAAVYVSGDIYFVDWNDRDQRLALIMCDLTGHGVQAALKATAAYVLAQNIWRAPKSNQQDRFGEFKRQLEGLMTLFSDTPDLATFGGIEFCPKTGELLSFHTNFNAPLIVERDDQLRWSLRSDSDLNTPQQTVLTTLKPESLLVLFSDGYVAQCRHLRRLHGFIAERLDQFDGSAHALKEMICSFDLQNPHRAADDRTMLVFKWKSEARPGTGTLEHAS